MGILTGPRRPSSRRVGEDTLTPTTVILSLLLLLLRWNAERRG